MRGRVVRDGPLQGMTLHNGQPAAYGSLRFPGRKSGPSKWAALSSATPIDQIIQMMVTDRKSVV